MSVKVLADKVLAFDRGEFDRNGILVTVRTKIGFNELPDWVEKTDYFKAAVKDGSLKPFTSAAQSEEVLKEQEKLAAIKAEIAALEEKRDLLAKSDTPDHAAEAEPSPTNAAESDPGTRKSIKPTK